MDRIITAMDVAKLRGYESAAGLWMGLAEASISAGRFQVRWDGQRVGGAGLQAYIDFGRWAVRCECGQNNYADPLERVMFCARCGNGNSGMARPVIFPQEGMRKKIEKAILARPVVEHPLAKNDVDKARLAKPYFDGLLRCWHPGETLDDLVTENLAHGIK